MPNCAILSCTNSSRKVGRGNGNVSFHRFPSDPNVKKKWIEATGHINWFPTKHSTICSVHFNDDSYTETKKFRRLNTTAIPTIAVLKTSTEDQNIYQKLTTSKPPPCNTPRKRKLEKVTVSGTPSPNKKHSVQKKETVEIKEKQKVNKKVIIKTEPPAEGEIDIEEHPVLPISFEEDIEPDKTIKSEPMSIENELIPELEIKTDSVESNGLDQMQLFANNVAEQLKKLPSDVAMNLQIKIQNLIAEERINYKSSDKQ